MSAVIASMDGEWVTDAVAVWRRLPVSPEEEDEAFAEIERRLARDALDRLAPRFVLPSAARALTPQLAVYARHYVKWRIALERLAVWAESVGIGCQDPAMSREGVAQQESEGR